MSTHSFSNLPEDTGQTIFEYAAQTRSVGVKCALVSKKVKFWVEPVIYRYIVFRDPRTIAFFHRTITDSSGESSKPVDFFVSHVKSLVVASYMTLERVATLLQVCRGVQSFAGWQVKERRESESQPALDEVLTSSLIAPARFSSYADIFPPDRRTYSLSIFRAITHLEIICRQSYLHDWEWATLASLTRLTHFSLDAQGLADYTTAASMFVENTISICPASLRVFIIFIDEGGLSPTYRPIDSLKPIWSGDVDPRAVVAFMGNPIPEQMRELGVVTLYSDLLDDWALVPKGRADCWTEAKMFIERRRQRVVLPLIDDLGADITQGRNIVSNRKKQQTTSSIGPA